MSSRREFLKSSSIMTVGGLVAATQLSGTVLPPPGHPPTPSHTPPLSVAVVGAAHTAVYNSWLRLQARKETPAGLNGTATAIAILHAQMVEVGWNKAVAPSIIASLKNEIATGRDLAPALIARGHQAGITITNAMATDVFSGGRARMEAMLTALNRVGGLYSVHNAITAKLTSLAYSFQSQGIKDIRISVCGAEAAECGILALFSPPPVDIIFGVLAGIFGLMEAFGFCGE